MKLEKTTGTDVILRFEGDEMSILAGCLLAISQQFEAIDQGILRVSEKDFTKVKSDFFKLMHKSNRNEG